MRVLVVGGYGFIGRAIGQELIRRGHEVVGWGRSSAVGRRILPDADWIEGDLRAMASPAAWRTTLIRVDAVVNASGALQDGAGGRLAQIQGDAIVALIDACAAQAIERFVQISAPGAEADAGTAFMATKAVADGHLKRSSLGWTILRPALVIGRNAFGGTALIRALAALPVAIAVHGGSPVQCVALDDVAAICADAIEGRLSTRQDLSLASPERVSLREIIAAHRRWLGLRPARFQLEVPPIFAVPLAAGADLAGWLGWRSPLRSTALKVMREGVILNDLAPPRPLASLQTILAANCAGTQDRIAARIFLILPLIVLALAALWIGSGVVGLIEAESAAAILGGGSIAMPLVRGCAIIDVLLGCMMLIRKWSRGAALAMMIVSVAYLLTGSAIVPRLWADPLAPLLKIVPSFVLALVAYAVLEER